MSKQKCLSFKAVRPTIQRLSIYQTNARIYIVGCDFSLSYYRLLKIDRTEPKDLIIDDDNRKYSEEEINEILKMIDVGNTNSVNKINGLQKTVSSFGIVGFVRFLEGYYILLITRRRKVAIIGGHFIYKIEDAVLTYISPAANKVFHILYVKFVARRILLVIRSVFQEKPLICYQIKVSKFINSVR